MKLSPFMTVLLTPSVWLLDKSYNPEWDKELRELIHNKTPIRGRTSRSLYLGNRLIWIDNDFGSLTNHNSERPSRHTICLLKQYI